MDRRYQSAMMGESRGRRLENSRYSSRPPLHTSMSYDATLKSPSKSLVSTYLSKPSSSIAYPKSYDSDEGYFGSGVISHIPSSYQSWSSRSAKDSAYNSQNYSDRYKQYLNNPIEKRIQPKETYKPYQSSTQEHYSSPQSQSINYYSSDTRQPSTFTTPPSQPLSILNRYISSQLNPYTQNHYGSGISYNRQTSVPNPFVELTNIRQSLVSRYNYEPLKYTDSIRYNNNSENLYSSSKPTLKRSQSQHVGRSLYKPASEIQVNRRESLSRPYYALKKEGDLMVKRTPTYQPISHTLNYDYRSDVSGASAVRDNIIQQPRQTLHQQKPFTLYQEQPDDTSVVAASNVVSTRTSAQREIEGSDRHPSISRSLARRSMTPMHNQSFLESTKTPRYTSIAVPERSRSVAVMGDQPMNRHLSFVSRPRSIMVTNKVESMAPSHRPSSIVNINRHSTMIPDHRSSIASNARSSVVGSSSSMFKVEPSKRNSHFEINGKEKYDFQSENLQDLRRKTWGAKDHMVNLTNNLPNKYGDNVKRSSYIKDNRSKTELFKNQKEEPGKLKRYEERYKSNMQPVSPSKVRSYTGSLYRVHIPDSFTPTISETRKKARDVLCKVRNDPNYFSFH